MRKALQMAISAKKERARVVVKRKGSEVAEDLSAPVSLDDDVVGASD